MNHNKFHNKILTLLTVDTRDLWVLATPAYITLVLLALLNYSPLPSAISLTSIVTAAIVLTLFIVYIISNRIIFNERAIAEAEDIVIEAVKETPKEDDIDLDYSEEEVVEEDKEVALTKSLDIVELEDYEDPFDFSTSILATYQSDSIKDMADVAVNTTKKKAESMLR